MASKGGTNGKPKPGDCHLILLPHKYTTYDFLLLMCQYNLYYFIREEEGSEEGNWTWFNL